MELYEVIGYTEGSAPLESPPQYQDLEASFVLSSLSLRVTDDADTDSCVRFTGASSLPPQVTVLKSQVRT